MKIEFIKAEEIANAKRVYLHEQYSSAVQGLVDTISHTLEDALQGARNGKGASVPLYLEFKIPDIFWDGCYYSVPVEVSSALSEAGYFLTHDKCSDSFVVTAK